MTTPVQTPPQAPGTISTSKLLLRVLWIVVELICVYAMAAQGQPFFYQGF
jgi:hypothetical protein